MTFEKYPDLSWKIKIWLIPLAFIAGGIEALILKVRGY